jgi:hypothetical protein
MLHPYIDYRIFRIIATSNAATIKSSRDAPNASAWVTRRKIAQKNVFGNSGVKAKKIANIHTAANKPAQLVLDVMSNYEIRF